MLFCFCKLTVFGKKKPVLWSWVCWGSWHGGMENPGCSLAFFNTYMNVSSFLFFFFKPAANPCRNDVNIRHIQQHATLHLWTVVDLVTFSRCQTISRSLFFFLLVKKIHLCLQVMNSSTRSHWCCYHIKRVGEQTKCVILTAHEPQFKTMTSCFRKLILQHSRFPNVIPDEKQLLLS